MTAGRSENCAELRRIAPNCAELLRSGLPAGARYSVSIDENSDGCCVGSAISPRHCAQATWCSCTATRTVACGACGERRAQLRRRVSRREVPRTSMHRTPPAAAPPPAAPPAAGPLPPPPPPPRRDGASRPRLLDRLLVGARRRLRRPPPSAPNGEVPRPAPRVQVLPRRSRASPRHHARSAARRPSRDRDGDRAPRARRSRSRRSR